MNPAILIHHYQEEYLDAFCSFFQSFDYEWTQDLSFEQVRTEVKHRFQNYDQSTLFLASENGVVRGYSAMHWVPFMILGGSGLEVYISELFVHSDCRGQGIGDKLLNQMETEAREKGAYRLLLNNFQEHESYKRQFYAKRGWEARQGAVNFVKVLKPLPRAKQKL